MRAKGSPEKKKKRPDDKEAVRRRRKRLRENPDFQAVLAEELEKASGGGECKDEHRGHAQQCNDALKQQVEVLMDWQISQKKYSVAENNYEARIVDMQDCINSLEEQVKLLQEIKGGQRGTITALHNRFAMKHGRKYTQGGSEGDRESL
jgi:hypothetical protein